MPTEKKYNLEKYHQFLVNLIAVTVISVFSYTTSMIVVAYQMGA
ncbi:MAG: hypothetical protein ACO3UU_02735 [Minisyncoccia bacterium]